MSKLTTLNEQLNEELNEEKVLFESWTGERDESGNLLENEVDWVNGKEWGEIPEDRKFLAVQTLQNIREDIEVRNPHLLSENNTATISTHDAILLPTWRMALAKLDALDLVGKIQMTGPEMSLYIERLGLGGKLSNGQEVTNIQKLQRTSADDPQVWNRVVYFIDVTADENVYNTLTIEDGVTDHGKVTNNADEQVGVAEYKELDTTGGTKIAKILVRLDTASTLPLSGLLKFNGVASAQTIKLAEDGALGLDFLLAGYNDVITTHNGETLNDFNTFQITLERVPVTAGMQAVGFEYTTALVQDMQKQFKVDARKRLATACHYQLASSISKRLFNLLMNSAEAITGWKYADAPGRHPEEKYAALMDKIRYERARIGQKTHVAPANKGVFTIGVSSIVSGRKGFVPMSMATGGAGLMKMGSIGGMDCYQVTFVTPGSEFVLLTLKQQGNEQACGAYYMPYIPVTIAGSDSRGISDYGNGMRSRVFFVSRESLVKNPFDASRYSTYFSVDLTGSSIL